MKTIRISLAIVFLAVSCKNEAEQINPLLALALLPTLSGILMDVHGAGAQRSDPKSGDVANYAQGHGPQGDVVRIYNYVRCVRGNSSNLNSYPIVSTGQSSCYDDGTTGAIGCPLTGQNYYGQDSQYSGLTQSYTDNADGTISDNATGLMWQKSFTKSSWSESASLAGASTTGGYSDWRVPTVKELYSIIDFDGATGSASPGSTSKPDDAIAYLDTTFFDFEYPSTGRYIDAQYITSTEYVSTVMNNERAFFGVNFADGRIKGYPQAGKPDGSTYYLRLVRGNAVYGQNNFVDNANDTITDSASGLVWTKQDSGHSNFASAISVTTKSDGSLNWSQALAFCEDLNFAGSTNWRLPDAKELHSIVDYTRSPDTTNSAAIASIFETSSIIDEGGQNDFPFYWSSTTHLDGKTLGQFAVYIAFGEAEGYMFPQGPDGSRPAQH